MGYSAENVRIEIPFDPQELSGQKDIYTQRGKVQKELLAIPFAPLRGSDPFCDDYSACKPSHNSSTHLSRPGLLDKYGLERGHMVAIDFHNIGKDRHLSGIEFCYLKAECNLDDASDVFLPVPMYRRLNELRGCFVCRFAH